MSHHLAKETLRTLISARNEPGADVEAVDARIWKIFGEKRTVLVTDMSGFTLRTDKFGITHFLSLIYAMRELAAPVLLEHDGFQIKSEADNLFVLFRDTLSAVRCAGALHSAASHYNRDRSTDEQISFCVGIGSGDILIIGDDDAFGAEINRAFKLGEDIARSGETLLTPDAKGDALVAAPELGFKEVTTDGAGLMTRYFALDHASIPPR